MAERLKPVDVVTIGVGLTGSLAALELVRAGLRVVGIERGAIRETIPDFQSPAIHDELRFAVRKALMQDNVKEAVTFRNSSDQTALPIRRWASFLPGTGLGGSFVHWNGQSFRFQVADFTYRTHIEQRYGKKFLDDCGPELTIQDWGVTYDELEPHYDRFEYLLGVSGKAGNIKGRNQPGGNPFEAPRTREYPTPPMKEPYFGALFRRGAIELGYHPYPQPSANLSEPYINPEGLRLEQCVFCGFCERFACEHFAKASPQTVILPILLKDPSYELRTNCQVLRINLDSTGKKATGVTYADATGREFEQPARFHRRPICRRDHDGRPSDRISSDASGNSQLGARLEASDYASLQSHCGHPAAWDIDGEPAQLSRSRPDLQGRLGSAAPTYDFRLPGQ
jgi:gluconate 2-dehydrogenase alpha chain